MKALQIAFITVLLTITIQAQTISQYPHADTVYIEYQNSPMVLPQVTEPVTGPDIIMLTPQDSTKFCIYNGTKTYLPYIFFTVNDSLNEFYYDLYMEADPKQPWWPMVGLFFETPQKTLIMGFWLNLRIYDSNQNFISVFRRYIMPELLDTETQIVKHSSVPSSPALLTNYPNPFNNRTCIEYKVIQDSHIELTIHDQTGRLVDILFSGFKRQGNYKLDWDARPYASGIYFISINSKTGISTHKILYLK